jgi:hypothetical protein
VRLSGVVKDNTVLRAKSLEVKLASAKGKVQVTFGECVLEVGDAPTREAEAGKKEEKKEEAKAANAEAPRSVSTPSAPPPPIS